MQWCNDHICLWLMFTFTSRPSLTPTTTPKTSTMTSRFWSCHPQFRWIPVCPLCAWPTPTPPPPLAPCVSPLGGARRAKPVSERLLSKSYMQCTFTNSDKLTQIWTVPFPQRKNIKATLNIHHTSLRNICPAGPHIHFFFILSNPPLPPADCAASAQPCSVQAVLG